MKKRHITLIVLAVIIGAAYVAAGRFVSTKGYDGLLDFIPSIVSNYSNKGPALDTLYLKIDKEGFEKFSLIRDKALETGIIVNSDDPWVEAKIKYKGDKIKSEIRLKGKMTDHVKGDKWSFRVKTKKGKLINGMHRFSLQHPGTRNYLYEWLHQQLANEQGLMSLNYQFVHVYLNKKDLGIYALEENFDKELAMNNARSLGPIFRFDPDAYWEYRMLGREGFRLTPEYTSFQSSFVDPMRSYSVKDSIQKEYLEEALLLMNSFRAGKIKAADALDIDLFAKKYAILDLVGGHHSVDWSDLKFYYDPIRKIIEPIAYESFSAHNIKTLIGIDKYRPNEKYHDDFHTVLFSDAAFYAKYVEYLIEFSEADFMPSFLAENDSAIQANLKVLNSEFPYKRFEDKHYIYNAKVIRKLLDPKYPLHVFFKEDKQSALQFGNVSSLPIVINAISKGDSLIDIEAFILPAKLSNGYIHYQDYPVDLESGDISVHYSVLGSKELKKAEVFDYEHPTTLAIVKEAINATHFIGQLFDQKGDSLIIRPGKHRIENNIMVDEHTTLIGVGKFELHFTDSAALVIQGVCNFEGFDENDILLINPQFIFSNPTIKSRFKNVRIKDVTKHNIEGQSYSAAFIIDKSSLKMEGCYVENAQRTIIHAVNSELELSNSSMIDVFQGIKLEFSSASLKNVAISDCEKNAITADASSIDLLNVIIHKSLNKGINIEKWSTLKSNNCKFSKNKTAIVCKSGSAASFKALILQNNTLDMEVKSKVGYGTSKLTIVQMESLEEIKMEKDEESLIQQ